MTAAAVSQFLALYKKMLETERVAGVRGPFGYQETHSEATIAAREEVALLRQKMARLRHQVAPYLRNMYHIQFGVATPMHPLDLILGNSFSYNREEMLLLLESADAQAEAMEAEARAEQERTPLQREGGTRVEDAARWTWVLVRWLWHSLPDFLPLPFR